MGRYGKAISHIEVIRERKKKTQLFPSRDRIDTAIWMHLMNPNETAGEKA